jgi:FtsZ-binding cell division protein ZapB|tara:strand:- start:884 stop:1153 length:270 start_codon:yes stop_codon:yes gene_type:complete
MAKTKTRPEKITDLQLKKIQDTINHINRSQLEIGSIEVKKHELMHQVSSSRDVLSEMQVEFQKDYGTYDIDISTGAINYPENGKADKKD